MKIEVQVMPTGAGAPRAEAPAVASSAESG
jgi:hypothetical protein